MQFIAVTLLATALQMSGEAIAQESTSTAPTAPAAAASTPANGTNSNQEKSGGANADTTTFLQQFALGVGSMSLGREEIKKAAVRGGVVQVDDGSRYRNSFWLQSSWIWALKGANTSRWLPSGLRPGVWAGLELGSDNRLASGVAAGVQMSFLQPGKPGENSRSSLNLGFGWYRSSIQVLGEGLEAGKALPAGVESVAYRQQGVTGTMWLLSLNVTGF